jgi:hypothetical protein
MPLTIKRLARGATIAAAILASSSLLEATGRPLFATLGDVAFNLTAASSEVEKVRRKITKAHPRSYVQAAYATRDNGRALGIL